MIRNTLVFCILYLFLFQSKIIAQPQPGDVFQEYRWTKIDGDAGGSLRVGGREGTTDWNTTVVNGYWETVKITLPHDIDLENVIKAEVNIEKILCHDGTQGLAISLNDHDWIDIPEAGTIPVPQWEFQHHIYPNVPIPFECLKQGSGNFFKMRVSDDHTWNWPQNLIYGVHIRVYYDAEQKPHPTGKIKSISNGQELGMNVDLDVDASSPNGNITQVDFVGKYEDVNFEGDNVYRQWHYHFFHGDILHHIGSVKSAPFKMGWDTEWVPDQKEPMELAVRIIDETGMIYFTESVKDLKLVRDGHSVELCKPYDVPQQ